jgi:hypothetical protein
MYFIALFACDHPNYSERQIASHSLQIKLALLQQNRSLLTAFQPPLLYISLCLRIGLPSFLVVSFLFSRLPVTGSSSQYSHHHNKTDHKINNTRSSKNLTRHTASRFYGARDNPHLMYTTIYTSIYYVFSVRTRRTVHGANWYTLSTLDVLRQRTAAERRHSTVVRGHVQRRGQHWDVCRVRGLGGD